MGWSLALQDLWWSMGCVTAMYPKHLGLHYNKQCVKDSLITKVLSLHVQGIKRQTHINQIYIVPKYVDICYIHVSLLESASSFYNTCLGQQINSVFRAVVAKALGRIAWLPLKAGYDDTLWYALIKKY